MRIDYQAVDAANVVYQIVAANAADAIHALRTETDKPAFLFQRVCGDFLYLPSWGELSSAHAQGTLSAHYLHATVNAETQ